MLDQLGLGIVLSMQDNFTPQANKAIQSMDRLTNSADEMEKNMQKSMSNLQNIMLAGFSLNQVGGDFQRAGKQILGVFGGITKEIVSVNSKFDTMRAQFKTVFGDMAEQKMKWATDFSIKTPFKVEETARLMQMMKYQGIDVTKQFAMANGEMKSLIEYMGDFSTKNMAQGIQGLAFGLSNAMGGNFKSISDRFDMGADQVERLREALKKGGNEGFIEEFTKLADEITPNAMKNMLGTWEQIIAEMEDTWDVFVWNIGDAGAFDPIKKTLRAFSIALSEIAGNQDSINNIALVFKELWKPVDFIAKGLIKITKSIINFALAHPTLTKIFSGFMAFSGVLLILSGTIMKLTGTFLILTTSIVSAYANLKVMETYTKVNTFSGLGLQVDAIAKSFLIFGLLAGATALAYKYNIGGMRDKTAEFTEEWDKARQLLDGGLGAGLKRTESMFGDTINSITKKFMRLQLIGTVLFNTLFGETVNGVLQYTQKELDNLRVMGLMKFAQTFAIIRGRVVSFAQGMEKGLTTAYKVAKSFLDFALIPIKAMLETIAESTPVKAISSLFNIKGMEGMIIGEAEEQLSRFKKLGEIIGNVVGAIIGLKAVGTLTSIITKPFRGLKSTIDDSKKSTDNLGKSLEKLSFNKGFKSLRGFFKNTSSKFNNFINKGSDIPKMGASSYAGYKSVNYSNAPVNLRDFSLRNGANPYSMYIKEPKGFIGKTSQALFGNRYYNPSEGGMQYVGRYGGKLARGVDNKQTRLASERHGVFKPTVHDLLTKYKGDKKSWKYDKANFINQDKRIGSVMDLKGGKFNEARDIIRNARDKRIEELISDPQFRKNAYQNAITMVKDKDGNMVEKRGISGRIFNGKEADRKSFLTRFAYEDSKVQRLSKGLQNLNLNAKEVAPIYQGKRGKLRQVLFGQRFYSPEQDANGRWYEKTVARRGGIFRNPENDMVYKDEGDVSARARALKLGSKLKDSKLGQGALGAFNSARGKVGGALSGFGANIGGRINGALGMPLAMINQQRTRLGWQPLQGKSTVGAVGQGLKGAGMYAWGGLKTTASATKKGFGMARRGFGAVGRGLGAVGRFGMNAMMLAPMVSMGVSAGKAGYDKVKEMGGGDVDKGVGVLRDKVAKTDFKGAFDGFTKSFSSTITSFFPLVKDVFGKIAQMMPTVLAEAWTGIKIGAQLAWDWVKANGQDVFTSFVQGVKPIISILWEDLKAGANSAWQWITTDGMAKLGSFIGQAVVWIAGTGVPMVVKALMGIGAWLMTDGLAGLISIAFQIAVGMGKAIWGALTGALTGLGHAVGQIILGGFKGTLKMLLPQALEEPVFKALGMDYHHQGLWMSPNEHTAVIRKDETVLPPDKSRKLDSFLNGVGRGGAGQSDNSINIDKVEIIVQADKLSRTDARAQAQMILEEFKKLQKEKNIRQYA